MLTTPFLPFVLSSSPLCFGLTWKGHDQEVTSPALGLCTGPKLAMGEFWGLCFAPGDPMIKDNA